MKTKEEHEISRIRELLEILQAQKEVPTAYHWNQLSGKIHRLSFRHKLWKISRIAAAIILPVLLFNYFIFAPSKDKQSKEKIEVCSAYGVISRIDLPDGSEVWLNSGSKLSYPREFDAKEREVHLEGEAYFKVKSDKKHRFNVQTKSGLVVSAYGTEFNVCSYNEDSQTNVVLAHGNVEIVTPENKQKKAMDAGQEAIYNNTTGNIDINSSDIYSSTAWKEGKMVFHREKFEDIVKKLSRRFNVDIILMNKELYEYEYSATFTTENLNEILKLLQSSTPIRYKSVDPILQKDNTYSKRKIIIHKK